MPNLENSTDQPLDYVISYTGTNSNGCSSTTSTTVTVYPEVTAQFSASVNGGVCGGSEVTFTNEARQAGVTYTWDFGDGTTLVSAEETVTHTFQNSLTSSSQTYNVTLTAQSDNYTCSTLATAPVTVYPYIRVSINEHAEKICSGESLTFVPNNSGTITSQFWGIRLEGTEAYQTSTTGVPNKFEFTNQTGAIQNWEVIYIGTSSFGCSDTARTSVLVYPATNPAFTVDNDKPRLPDALVTITNTMSQDNVDWTYSWDFGDGTTFSGREPGTHQYSAYGDYEISLTVNNGYCTETFTLDIEVQDIIPIPSFTANVTSGCAPLTVQFTNTSQFADPNTYEWDFGDQGITSREVNPTYTYTRPGYYQVKLRARNGSGNDQAEFVLEEEIWVYPTVDAYFERFTANQLFVGRETYLEVNSQLPDSLHHWQYIRIKDGEGNPVDSVVVAEYNEQSPIHKFRLDGEYLIVHTVKSIYGCEDTHQITVSVEGSGEMRVPNAFIPSGTPGNGMWDQYGEDNSVFYPYLDSVPQEYTLRIYNRWGEMLFESTDYYQGWNGYYKGELSKADVYVYKLVVKFTDGQAEQRVGNFTLIR
jgi:gliding motility-associated-like protein